MGKRMMPLALWLGLWALGSGACDSSSPPTATSSMRFAGFSAQVGGGGGPAPVEAIQNDDPSLAVLDVDWEALQLARSPLYTAFDGEHWFQVPAWLPDVPTAPADWRAFPADAVEFETWGGPDGERGVLITVQRHVPEVRLSVRAGDQGARGVLYITDATAGQWARGRDRYVYGAPFDLDALRSHPEWSDRYADIIAQVELTEAGRPAFFGMAGELGLSTDLRCHDCHTPGADHFHIPITPREIGGLSDEELHAVFTQGIRPPGARSVPPFTWSEGHFDIMHRFQVSESQATGLVVYMRSLTPAQE